MSRKLRPRKLRPQTTKTQTTKTQTTETQTTKTQTSKTQTSKTQTSKAQTLFKTIKYNKIIKYFLIYLQYRFLPKLWGLIWMTLPRAERGEFLEKCYALCMSQIQESPSPPGQPPGIWHELNPGWAGIWHLFRSRYPWYLTPGKNVAAT